MTFQLAPEEWRQCGQANMEKENSKLRRAKTGIYQFRAYLGKGKPSPRVCNIVHMQELGENKSGYVN